MSNQTKTYQAGADIEGNRFISFATEESVVKTADATSTVIGTTGFIGAIANSVVDIDHNRVVEVQLGGTVAQGDELVSDATGKAVKAGSEVTPVAVALASGTADAIVYVLMK